MKDLDISVVVLRLINQSLHKEERFDVNLTEADWEQIYHIAVMNTIVPVLYPVIEELSKEGNIPSSLFLTWKREAAGLMLMESTKYMALRNILQEADKHNLTLVLFKGCALADLYPQYLSRISCDTDLFVYDRDKEKAVALFEELGYQKLEMESKEQVYVYVQPFLHHKIELHFSLWEDYKGAVIKLLNDMLLTEEKTLLHKNACGMQITTLGYEEHLLYQIFHIIKHFSLQGIGIRYLIDITLYVNRYGKFIDFLSFWDKITMLHYVKFCENFFSLCIWYLGMQPDIMQDRRLRDKEETQALLEDIINIGTILEGWRILGIITPYFTGEQDIPNSKLARYVRILCPKLKNLPEEYSYARKLPILLPISWIHKSLKFLIRWIRHKEDWFELKKKWEIAESRLSLMRSLDMMDRKIS